MRSLPPEHGVPEVPCHDRLLRVGARFYLFPSNYNPYAFHSALDHPLDQIA